MRSTSWGAGKEAGMIRSKRRPGWAGTAQVPFPKNLHGPSITLLDQSTLKINFNNLSSRVDLAKPPSGPPGPGICATVEMPRFRSGPVCVPGVFPGHPIPYHGQSRWFTCSSHAGNGPGGGRNASACGARPRPPFGKGRACCAGEPGRQAVENVKNTGCSKMARGKARKRFKAGTGPPAPLVPMAGRLIRGCSALFS